METSGKKERGAKEIDIFVTLPFFLSHLCPRKEVKIKIESGTKLKDILGLMPENVRENLERVVLDPAGNFRPSIRVAINQKLIKSKDHNMVIDKPCRIAFIAVAAGG